MNLLLVMLGGALGSGGRYLVGAGMLRVLGPGWPWETLMVNLVGGFAMGLLAGTLSRVGGGESWRLFLGVGVLGGFTTFSAFSLDTMVMLERGAWAAAGGYVALSVIGAVVALATGLAAVRVAA